MRAVNLLPSDAYAPKQRLPHAPIVLAATAPVLAGALVYLGYSFEHSKVVSRQSQLGLVQSQIAALAPSPALIAESSTIASERSSREAALQDALSKRVAWDVMFDRLGRVFPADSWLTGLSAQSPTPASSTSPTSNPTGFTATGYADSQATVALILTRLSLVPGLSNVVLTSTTTTTVGSKTVIQFSLTAQVGGLAG
jgi:Tfp pilus assembly protein PilN